MWDADLHKEHGGRHHQACVETAAIVGGSLELLQLIQTLLPFLV
jgi:hypothetical protein